MKATNSSFGNIKPTMAIRISGGAQFPNSNETRNKIFDAFKMI